jgi:hypothetical protein
VATGLSATERSSHVRPLLGEITSFVEASELRSPDRAVARRDEQNRSYGNARSMLRAVRLRSPIPDPCSPCLAGSGGKGFGEDPKEVAPDELGKRLLGHPSP